MLRTKGYAVNSKDEQQCARSASSCRYEGRLRVDFVFHQLCSSGFIHAGLTSAAQVNIRACPVHEDGLWEGGLPR